MERPVKEYEEEIEEYKENLIKPFAQCSFEGVSYESKETHKKG